MGFEQLAALRAQLTKEAKLKKQQERGEDTPAQEAKPAGKSAGKPGAKTERPARPARPARAGTPARTGAPARTGEKTPPVDPVVRVIGTLQKRFPAAFPKNPAPKVPLKVGILADLLAQASDLQLTEAQIREAVSTWCRGSRYWACLTDGAARVDLSGAPAGTVTSRDAAFARNQAKGGGGRRKGPGKPNPSSAAAGQPGESQPSDGQATLDAAGQPEHSENSQASHADTQDAAASNGEAGSDASPN